jgi:hypothetical protein
MKSIALNSLFLIGASCIVSSAFLIALPLGLFVLGCPLVAISLHASRKTKKVKT